MSTASTAFGGMFDFECDGCGAAADYDVEVMDKETGETVRDVYACEGCAREIDVPDRFHVAAEGV